MWRRLQDSHMTSHMTVTCSRTHQSSHQVCVKGGGADVIDHAAHITELRHLRTEALSVAPEAADRPRALATEAGVGPVVAQEPVLLEAAGIDWAGRLKPIALHGKAAVISLFAHRARCVKHALVSAAWVTGHRAEGSEGK